MKQKRQLVILGGLLAVAAAVFYFDQRGPGQGVQASSEYRPLTIENPSLRRDKLRDSQETEYRSSGRDLFSDAVAPPPRPKPKQTDPTPYVPPAPAPPP